MHTPAEFFIGFDGGGTRTRAALISATDGPLAEARSGPGNSRLGHKAAMQCLAGLAETCLEQAGLSASVGLKDLSAAAGLAGLTFAAERDAMAAMPHPFGVLTLTSDAHIAHIAAFNGGHGGLVILGTGSAGLVGDRDTQHYIGGWGFEVSDDGGGARMGRRAVRAAVLAADGLIPASPFTDTLLARWRDLPDLAVWATRATPADYGQLAPAVISAAEGGDPVARDIVQEQAALADALINAVIHAAGEERVALMGGMVAPLRPFLNKAGSTFTPQSNALTGALILAGHQP